MRGSPPEGTSAPCPSHTAIDLPPQPGIGWGRRGVQLRQRHMADSFFDPISPSSLPNDSSQIKHILVVKSVRVGPIVL